ncbi:GNAT family N-acetyltransferase [Propylenella binzhouense]|uniref:N-acetyltransferase n=1 Tax=Propylenella binzhouense TaxID=2555902 RepID=A0A964WU74_9HYPH|nr:GNAT family protein [Propylenella binzhouense]MYZ48560.1 N-acetyltransferase [Propylenella binzhouense]
MAFLRSTSGYDPAPVISGRGVFLRSPTYSDYVEWAMLRGESRSFLTPWEPSWPADDLTRSAFRRRIRRYHQEIREDRAYPFFVYRAGEAVLVGGITLSNVTRGMTQTGTIGYWMGERYANNGYMTAALTALIPFAFGILHLHRLEAACLVHNAPSRKVLQKVGFREEGLARGLVCINGRWQDHVVYGLLADDPKPWEC